MQTYDVNRARSAGLGLQQISHFDPLRSVMPAGSLPGQTPMRTQLMGMGYEQGRTAVCPGGPMSELLRPEPLRVPTMMEPTGLIRYAHEIEILHEGVNEMDARMRALEGVQIGAGMTQDSRDVGGPLARPLTITDVRPGPGARAAIDLFKVTSLLALARGIEIQQLTGSLDEINDYSVEGWMNNITGPYTWRGNGDSNFTDYVGHPLLGFTLNRIYQGMGYDNLQAFAMTALTDIVWEFGIEGMVATPEFCDLVTTGLLGNLLGSLYPDDIFLPGGIDIVPTMLSVAPGRYGIGLSLGQTSNPLGTRLNVGMRQSPEGTIGSVGLSNPNASVDMMVRMGEGNRIQGVGINFGINF